MWQQFLIFYRRDYFQCSIWKLEVTSSETRLSTVSDILNIRGAGQGDAGARVPQPLTPDVWQRGTGLRDKHRVPGHGLPRGPSNG